MIACIGDLMVDVFPDGPAGERRHPGGKAAIYAVTARALGSPVAVLGSVGTDEDGRAVAGILQRAGVDISGIVKREGTPTGADYFEENGWRMERGANWELAADDVEVGLARLLDGGVEVDAVIVNQGIPLEASQAAVRFARDRGLFLVLHLGPEAIEARRKVDPAFYPLADVIVVSRREADVLAEHLGLDTEGRSDEVVARMLFDGTRPRWALLLSFGVGGAHVVAHRPDGVHEAAVAPSSGPDHEAEKYIGANDTAVAAWVTWLVSGATPPADQDFDAVRDLLDRAVRLAAVNLVHPGPLTAAVLHSADFVAGASVT
ncbi:carbohydrate kinase family protein [Streptomyces cyaneofuscatus]|uniref:carbohydrate kinase family protein n=1 Tax=Streptomyces cyaneofuscatus TaxID=66883 RepID=UPI0037B12EA8